MTTIIKIQNLKCGGCANTIIKIDTSEGYVSKFAGVITDNNGSHLDGSLDDAKFSRSTSISINNSSIFVVDQNSHRIRKIDLIPSIKKEVNFNEEDIKINDETIKHIIDKYTEQEQGVRNLKRCLEIIHTKLTLRLNHKKKLLNKVLWPYLVKNMVMK